MLERDLSMLTWEGLYQNQNQDLAAVHRCVRVYRWHAQWTPHLQDSIDLVYHRGSHHVN